MKVSKKITQIKEANDKLSFLYRKHVKTLVKKIKLRIEMIKLLIEIYEGLHWINENTPVDVVYVGFCNAYLYRLKYKYAYEEITIYCNEDFLSVHKDCNTITKPLTDLRRALIEHKIDVSALTLTEY